MQKIEIPCATIELLDSGIISIQYRSDFKVELKDVKEVEKAFISLSKGEDIYCLMDTSRRLNNYTVEAQNFLSKEASIVKDGKMKCSALVIDNLPNRLLARFFKNFYKPSFAMKIFRNQMDAKEWLMSKRLKRKEILA